MRFKYQFNSESDMNMSSFDWSAVYCTIYICIRAEHCRVNVLKWKKKNCWTHITMVTDTIHCKHYHYMWSMLSYERNKTFSSFWANQSEEKRSRGKFNFNNCLQQFVKCVFHLFVLFLKYKKAIKSRVNRILNEKSLNFEFGLNGDFVLFFFYVLRSHSWNICFSDVYFIRFFLVLSKHDLDIHDKVEKNQISLLP